MGVKYIPHNIRFIEPAKILDARNVHIFLSENLVDYQLTKNLNQIINKYSIIFKLVNSKKQ